MKTRKKSLIIILCVIAAAAVIIGFLLYSFRSRETGAPSYSADAVDWDGSFGETAEEDFMKYTVQPKLTDGTYGDALTDFDQELLAFTENGTKYYRVKPLEDTQTAEHPYWWGQINFTVSVENLPAATN